MFKKVTLSFGIVTFFIIFVLQFKIKYNENTFYLKGSFNYL